MGNDVECRRTATSCQKPRPGGRSRNHGTDMVVGVFDQPLGLLVGTTNVALAPPYVLLSLIKNLDYM
jgi:hypothetical protein